MIDYKFYSDGSMKGCLYIGEGSGTFFYKVNSFGITAYSFTDLTKEEPIALFKLKAWK